jgi:hypothetical protein
MFGGNPYYFPLIIYMISMVRSNWSILNLSNDLIWSCGAFDGGLCGIKQAREQSNLASSRAHRSKILVISLCIVLASLLALDYAVLACVGRTAARTYPHPANNNIVCWSGKHQPWLAL